MPQVAWEDSAGSGDDALVATSNSVRTPMVADEYGNPMHFGTTDNALATFPIDERVVEFVEYGVLNGSFARGPASPNDLIEDINALPDWRGPVSVSGGAMTAQWVTQSNAPSGHSLDVSMNAGAASDEIYFEQIVPIGGSNPIWIGHTIRVGFGAYVSSSASVTLEAQYLDATEATLGSATTTNSGALSAVFAATGSGNLLTTLRVTIGTARFLRLRLHVLRDAAAASDTGTPLVTFTDVRVTACAPYLAIRETTGFTFPSDTPTPASGMHAIYAKTVDSKLYSMDDSGNEYLLSTGISTYVGNTAWTPALAFATVGSSTWTGVTQVGRYWRVGPMVYFTILYSATLTKGSGSGNLQLTGWPVTPDSTASSNARIAVNIDGYTKAGYTFVHLNIVPGSTTANFIAGGSGVALALLTAADMVNGTVDVVVSGFYWV